MAALTEDRDTVELASGYSQFVSDYGNGVPAAGSVFYRGALVCFDTADAGIKPGETSTTLVALGRCENYRDANEDAQVHARCGIFHFANSAGGDEIVAADIGASCYVVDDQTVAKTDGTGTRSVAGKVYKIDATGVYVGINPLL
jgi:hypothetical protein